MKKIVINGDYLSFQTFGGVSRYAAELLKEFDLLIDSLDVEMVTPEYTADIPKFKNIKVVKYGCQPILKWKNISLPKYIKRTHSLLIDLTQAFPMNVKGITYAYDCIPELVPSAYSGFIGKYIKKPLKLIQRRIAIKSSLAILTTSDYSKQDIVRIYHIAPEKIKVIGGAWQHIKGVPYDYDIIKKYGLEDTEFYFTLGSRVPHKNLQWIVAAARQNRSSLFVVSGENSYCKNFNKDHFPENIIFTGYISNSEIRSLMAKCKAFIFPSIYEGFGIPPMEALAEGAPIIISNASCLPGVYGNSAHYIDPYTLEGIDLESILTDTVENPQNILDKYSWDKSAKELYEVVLKYV